MSFFNTLISNYILLINMPVLIKHILKSQIWMLRNVTYLSAPLLFHKPLTPREYLIWHQLAYERSFSYFCRTCSTRALLLKSNKSLINTCISFTKWAVNNCNVYAAAFSSNDKKVLFLSIVFCNLWPAHLKVRKKLILF